MPEVILQYIPLVNNGRQLRELTLDVPDASFHAYRETIFKAGSLSDAERETLVADLRNAGAKPVISTPKTGQPHKVEYDFSDPYSLNTFSVLGRYGLTDDEQKHAVVKRYYMDEKGQETLFASRLSDPQNNPRLMETIQYSRDLCAAAATQSPEVPSPSELRHTYG